VGHLGETLRVERDVVLEEIVPAAIELADATGPHSQEKSIERLNSASHFHDRGIR